MAGRTALHIAAKYNYLESVKVLLYELANPFRKDHGGKMAIDLTKSLIVQYFLNRARLVKINIIFLVTYYPFNG
jgi:hypothetical protein